MPLKNEILGHVASRTCDSFRFGVRPGNVSLTGILGDSDHQTGSGNTAQVYEYEQVGFEGIRKALNMAGWE